jgi:hypothetical protein
MKRADAKNEIQKANENFPLHSIDALAPAHRHLATFLALPFWDFFGD